MSCSKWTEGEFIAHTGSEWGIISLSLLPSSHFSPCPSFSSLLLYTIPGSHLQDNMNENIHQCYCVICEQRRVCACVCVCVERHSKASWRGGGSRMEGVGGGQRTKETNLNEMTCFERVKSGELGFSILSPWRQIHLERPDLRVYTHEHINGQKEPTERVKQIGVGGEERGDRDLV